MRKLMKNSKAIIGAVSLVLASYTDALAGIGELQRQSAGNPSLSAAAVGAHAGLMRPPARSAKVTSSKKRRQARNTFVHTSTSFTALALRSAGPAYYGAATPKGEPGQLSASPRAPPLS
jgi:hypothetical protein